MKDIIINAILINITLAFLGRFITLYVPFLSENSLIELLNMNQRKIVTSSVITLFTIFMSIYLVNNNIKIKNV